MNARRRVPRALAALALAGSALTARALPLSVQVVDADGQPAENAVVAVMVKGARERAEPGVTAEMAQRSRNFVPQVLAVQTGTPVTFPNLDTVRHHVYSFSPTKPFEIRLYAGIPSAPVVFDKAGTAVLGCNIHDRMSAFVHVVDTPHFARTDAEGRATIDVPAGEHRVRLWHPSLQASGTPIETPLVVSAAAALVKLRLVQP